MSTFNFVFRISKPTQAGRDYVHSQLEAGKNLRRYLMKFIAADKRTSGIFQSYETRTKT